MPASVASNVKLYVTDDFSDGGSLDTGVEVHGTEGAYLTRHQVDYSPPPQGRYVGLRLEGITGQLYEVEVYPTGKLKFLNSSFLFLTSLYIIVLLVLSYDQ